MERSSFLSNTMKGESATRRLLICWDYTHSEDRVDKAWHLAIQEMQSPLLSVLFLKYSQPSSPLYLQVPHPLIQPNMDRKYWGKKKYRKLQKAKLEFAAAAGREAAGALPPPKLPRRPGERAPASRKLAPRQVRLFPSLSRLFLPSRGTPISSVRACLGVERGN